MFDALAVVIDVAPEAAEPLAEAAVQSCDAALGHGRCRIADPYSETGDARAEWYAVVRWEGERLEIARIDFRRRHAAGPLLRSRQIVFSPQDDARDRWASVGVLIAALVASQEERVATPPPPSGRADPMRDEPSTDAAGSKQLDTRSRWRLDVTASMSRSLERGGLQPGLALRPSFELGTLPLFVTGSVGYSWRPSTEPQVSWLSEGFGFGVRIGPRDAMVGVELRSELVTEQWLIEAMDSNRSESEWVFRFGARMGLDAVWNIAPRLSLLIGAQASVVRPEVSIDVAAQHVERVPDYCLSALAGIRWIP